MSGAGFSEVCFRFSETRLSQDGCKGIFDSGGFWKRLLAWERDWWKSGGDLTGVSLLSLKRCASPGVVGI